MLLLTIQNYRRTKQKYGQVRFQRVYTVRTVLTASVHILGKDYSNPRVLDFHTLHKPEEDMYDRSKVPRMPWCVFAKIVVEEANPSQARCWDASCRPTDSRSSSTFCREVCQSKIYSFYLLIDNTRWNWLLRIKVWFDFVSEKSDHETSFRAEPYEAYAIFIASSRIQTRGIGGHGSHRNLRNADLSFCWSVVAWHTKSDRTLHPKRIHSR